MEPFAKIKTLGNGSHSIVHLVERKRDKKPFALKEVGLASENSPHSVLGEYKLLNNLRHPNIVKLAGSEVEQGQLRLLLEYADDGDVSQKIAEMKKTDDPIPEKLIMEWLCQLCFALKYIHCKNIIHRDIKPNNILCMKNGIIKLSDFGISKALECNKYATSNVGTPYYLAPEIVSNKPYDFKVDIWMLGCTIYELCAKKKPFLGESLADILMKIINMDPLEIDSEIYSDFLTKLIKRMLSKDPKQRPTATEILQMKELTPTILELRHKYSGLYRSQGCVKGKRIDLELEIQEDVVKTAEIGRPVVSMLRKGPRNVNSTTNKLSDKSIFSVLEKVKAKSNGTTPQNLTITPQGSDATGFFSSVSKPLGKGKSFQLGELSYGIPCTEIKDRQAFASPSNMSLQSPITYFNTSQKKSKGFSFISNVFSKNIPISPGRKELATKFIRERLGDKLFHETLLIKENNPEGFLPLLKELYGQKHRHLLPIIEYVFILEEGVSSKLSPFSNITTSTNTHEDDPNLTFGAKTGK